MVFLGYIKNVFSEFKKRNRLAFFRAKWRKRNKDNLTNPGRLFPIDSVSVGRCSYGTLNVVSYGASNERLEIGSFCSIAGNVFFLLSGEHNYKSFLTYPVGKLIIDGKVEARSKGPIIVQDDVWIGFGSIILSGVTIGKGAIIAAGSVVTKDVPPFSVWINNSVYKYRFNEKVIDKLCAFDYSLISAAFIKENPKLFVEDLDESIVERITNI